MSVPISITFNHPAVFDQRDYDARPIDGPPIDDEIDNVDDGT